MRKRISAFLLGSALAAGLLSTTALGDQAADPSWKITGQLEEACTCNAACPCWFGSNPSHTTCGGGEVLFIESGKYGNVRLDGLSVGSMGESPENQSMMESFGNWKFANVYIDEKANAEQRKALENIIDAVSGVASKNRQVRYIPLSRTIEGKEHRVHLGEYGNFGGHLLEGGLGGPVTIQNPPGADPIRKQYNQGVTTLWKFADSNSKWDTSGSNYMHAIFTVTSEDYAKYAAGLAQKMEEMKKR